ncbi:MAG: nidogen-like domain-containing protein, partial [Candidatus Brocadiia bacterium]
MNSNVWRPLLIVATIVFCLAFTNVQAAQQTNPDPTGYTWKDNKSPEPKETATFIDISTTGTDLISAPGFTDFDNGSIGITTPFLVTLFGNLYGMGGAPLYVSINGVVSFGTPITGIVSSVNTSLPNASDPDNIIAVFWDDLDASNGGHIYYDVVGTEPNRMIIVQWSNLSFRDQTANLNFQIQIPETVTANPYYLVYGNMTSPDAARATGSSATIGLENSDGSLGTEYSYNIPNIIISGQTAIGFYPPLSLIALPRLVKGAGFADNMRVLWGSLTPSIVAVHFLLFSPVEEGVELTGIELSAMLPDDPNALDFDESKYISGINLYEDVDRNASISSSERNNNLIVAWQPSQQQPFSNNGTLVLTFGGQTVIATASRAYIGEVIFNTNVTPLPSEGEGFKMALHRVYYRGLASNASRIETLDYMTGSVYVEDGFNPYGSVSIMPYNYDSDSVLVTSGSSVVAMAFKLTIGTVEDVRIQTLTCRALSTGVISTDIISVTFYIDQNVNGRHDTGEPTAGTAFSFPT